MKCARRPRARSCGDLVAKVRDFEFYSNLMKIHGKGLRTEGLLCARGSLTFTCFFSCEVTPLGHRHVYRSSFGSISYSRPVCRTCPASPRHNPTAPHLSCTVRLSLLAQSFSRSSLGIHECQQFTPSEIALDQKIMKSDGYVLLLLFPWIATSNLDFVILFWNSSGIEHRPLAENPPPSSSLSPSPCLAPCQAFLLPRIVRLLHYLVGITYRGMQD